MDSTKEESNKSRDGKQESNNVEHNGNSIAASLEISHTIAPSLFLSSASYLELAKKNIRGVFHIELSFVDDSMKQ